MEFLSPESLIALLTLSVLEIVLGIDNIVFIALLTNRLPSELQKKARQLGLTIAMVMRIILLFAVSWVMGLKEPFFSIASHPFSGRDLIMLGGGLFLLAKATFEIHETIEGGEHRPGMSPKKKVTMSSVLLQIAIVDIVFSLDSVITAVGMVKHIEIMVVSVVLAMAVMLIFAEKLAAFITEHPTVKMLALSFLILIGFVLVVDGLGKPIEKGYIYFALGFSVLVEALNLRLQKKSKTEQKS